MTEFNLSNYIEYGQNGMWIEKCDVKEFIRLLKDKNHDMVLQEYYGEYTESILNKEIDKLAGDKLI